MTFGLDAIQIGMGSDFAGIESKELSPASG